MKQEDREDRTSRRAYQLWLDAGLSDGASLEYWQAAQEQEAAQEAMLKSPSEESFPAGDPAGERGLPG